MEEGRTVRGKDRQMEDKWLLATVFFLRVGVGVPAPQPQEPEGPKGQGQGTSACFICTLEWMLTGRVQTQARACMLRTRVCGSSPTFVKVWHALTY